MPYTFLEHTADIRMRVTGGSLEELFRDALLGMMHVLSPSKVEGKKINPVRSSRGVLNHAFAETDRHSFPGLAAWRSASNGVKRIVNLTADDKTALLIDFLSEVLLLAYTHKETYDNAALWLENGKLKAELEGYKVDSFAEDIKAVTYHEADVRKTENGWKSNVVFDI